MSRILIQTAIIDGKQHATVYLSDGITITERAGEKIIPTIIRTVIAHKRDQRKIRKQIQQQSKPKNQTTSFRITRFKSRVNGIGV